MDRPSYSRHSIVATPVGGRQYTITVRDHQLLTDQPARAGGADAAPTPLELLGASLSGCVALYAHKYCEAAGIDGSDLAVEVRPFWREDRIGRFDVLLHLPESIPTEHHAELEVVARNCPVHHTLASAPQITFQLLAVAPAGA